ncbi:ArfGEF [Acrasis kona]|uniref:ArfGEF n=1 Tax=Acrasis kona TaxID=1008807 RepID=A0AAW2ZRY8_9EUKA
MKLDGAPSPRDDDESSDVNSAPVSPSNLFKKPSPWVTQGIGRTPPKPTPPPRTYSDESRKSPNPQDEQAISDFSTRSTSPNKVEAPLTKAKNVTSPNTKDKNKSSMKKAPKKEAKVDKTKRIVVIGCRDVGKTSLTFRFIHNEFFYYDQLRMKRSTSESDLQRVANFDELSERKKYNLEPDDTEIKEQKELLESFGCKVQTPLPSTPSTVSSFDVMERSRPPAIQLDLMSSNMTDESSQLSTSNLMTPNSPPVRSPSVDIEVIANRMNLPDMRVMPSDSQQTVQLKNFVLQLTEELYKSNKEREDLAEMWKLLRADKLLIEEQYERVEAELSHLRYIHSQIGELLKFGNNFDPSATQTTVAKLDNNNSLKVTSPTLSTTSTTSTTGSVLTIMTPMKPTSFQSPTHSRNPSLYASHSFATTNHDSSNNNMSPMRPPLTPKNNRSMPAHMRRASMQIVAGNLLQDEISEEIRKFDAEAELALTNEPAVLNLEQLEQEEFAREVAKHNQMDQEAAAEMNDIMMDFAVQTKSESPAKDATLRTQTLSDMNTENSSDLADNVTDNETDESASEYDFDDIDTCSFTDRLLTPTTTHHDLDIERSRSQSHCPVRIPAQKNIRKLELKTPPTKSPLMRQVSAVTLSSPSHAMTPHLQHANSTSSMNTPSSTTSATSTSTTITTGNNQDNHGALLSSQSTNTPPGSNEPDRLLRHMMGEMVSPSFILSEGIRRFNKSIDKPQQGLLYLQQMNILTPGDWSDDHVTKCMARFLSTCNNLSKAQVGLLLGNPKNEKLLSEYVSHHANHLYANQKFDYCLRHFFSLFKLPLEGQQVTRVCEEFANAYVRCNPHGPLKDPSDTFLVVACLLMVNQELHNPKSTTKMTRQQFLDIFKLADIPSAFLTEIYDNIKKKAMVLEDEDVHVAEAGVNQYEDEEGELLINDDTIEHYLLMENRRRPPSQSMIAAHQEQDRIGVMGSNIAAIAAATALSQKRPNDGDPVTFLFKVKMMMRNKLRHFQIKDSDPDLVLENNMLKRSNFLDREIAKGHFFLVTYSVTDAHTFKIAQCLIDRILEMKRNGDGGGGGDLGSVGSTSSNGSGVNGSSNNNQVRKKKKTAAKHSQHSHQQSITDLINEELDSNQEQDPNDELILLVGCKCDDVANRQVTYRQGVDYALQKAIAFYEVSSMDNHKQKIRGLFMSAFESILRAERTKRDDSMNKNRMMLKSMNIEQLLNQPKCYID